MNEESSSSLSSPGNPAAEVNELFRARPVPVRMPGLLPGSEERLAIHLLRHGHSRNLRRFTEFSGRGGKHGPKSFFKSSRFSGRGSSTGPKSASVVSDLKPSSVRAGPLLTADARPEAFAEVLPRQTGRQIVIIGRKRSTHLSVEVRATTAGSGLGSGFGSGSPATPGSRCATTRSLDS